MKKVNRIVTMSIAIIAIVIIVGTPALVAGYEEKGYTKQDRAFFYWTEEELNERQHIDSYGLEEGGNLGAYWFSKAENLYRKKIAELDGFEVLDNVQEAKDIFERFLLNMAAAADYAGRGTSTNDKELLAISEGLFDQAQIEYQKFLAIKERIIGEGLVGDYNEEQPFLVTPFEAAAISSNSEEVKAFLRSADCPVHLEIAFTPDRGVYEDILYRKAWIVIWTAGDKAISTVVDIEVGHLPGGSSTGSVINVAG
jgi:hypothetical protein